MARDPRHLERLYGEPPTRPAFVAGPGLAVWTVGLLLAAAGSAVLSVVSLGAATTPDATTVQLREWGVLHADEPWIALHADDPMATSGCVITGTALVRWDDRHPTARITLDAATTTLIREADGLRLSAAGAEIFCPSDPGSDLRLFTAFAETRAQARRSGWHPGPDPRVAHLYR